MFVMAESITAIWFAPAVFARLGAGVDGSITAWGGSDYGGADAPSTGVYTKIYSNSGAFAVSYPMP
jgi:hypothetical protein